MPVRSINFLQERPPARNGRNGGLRVEATPEYQDVVMMLGAGLKPQEFLELWYPPEHSIWKHGKHPLESASRALKIKIRDLKLPYDCYIRAGKLYIVGRGVE